MWRYEHYVVHKKLCYYLIIRNLRPFGTRWSSYSIRHIHKGNWWKKYRIRLYIFFYISNFNSPYLAKSFWIFMDFSSYKQRCIEMCSCETCVLFTFVFKVPYSCRERWETCQNRELQNFREKIADNIPSLLDIFLILFLWCNCLGVQINTKWSVTLSIVSWFLKC